MFRKSNAVLPTIKDKIKTKDNRTSEAKDINITKGLLPMRTRSAIHADALISFTFHTTNTVVPAHTTLPSRPSVKLKKALKDIPPLVQARLKSVRTKYSLSNNKLIANAIQQLPTGIAQSSDTCSVYASYFLTFLSFYEYMHCLKVSQNCRYSPRDIFQFCQHLIAAEYSNPLIYYNVVVMVLLQSQTPTGERGLIVDGVTALDISAHRESLHRYQRKFSPDQAPIITQHTILSSSATRAQVALILVWMSCAARLSSVEGLEFVDTQRQDNGVAISATVSMVHLKGSLSSSTIMKIFCNCKNFPLPGYAGDIFCPLHSGLYNLSNIPTPVSRQFAYNTINALGVQTHSPRVTTALTIFHMRENSQIAFTQFHISYINYLFAWSGSQDTMYKYYTRMPAKFIDACSGGRYALPAHALARACQHDGWIGDTKVANIYQPAAPIPAHVIELLESPDTQLNF